MIASILADYPDLCANGFRFESSYPQHFDLWRAEMTEPDCIAQFERASEFLLKHCKSRKSCASPSSYAWKHVAERWHKIMHPGQNPYVSNGVFIVAAAAHGYIIKRIPNSPNCFLNISQKSLTLPPEDWQRHDAHDAHDAP
jgi:hypothetical protein